MTVDCFAPSRPKFLADVSPCDPARVRVAVLMGGIGSEREVSLMSGREVARGLQEAGFAVRDIDLKPEHVGELRDLDIDVAFIALHGAYGEDGRLQRQLDEMGIPYVGSGAEASCLAMDKVASKERFVAAGLATPDWRVIRRADEQTRQQAYEALGPDVVVKPVAEGSSVAVHLTADAEQYRLALNDVLAHYDAALVERRIFGRELTIGVLHEQGLSLVEIVPTQEFYNYDAKYFDDSTGYLIDPDLPHDVVQRVRRAAVTAHKALGCRGFSRVDMILQPDGTAPVLELNTIPGFTTHSLLPKSASGAGISFAGLCRYIVEIALHDAAMDYRS
ncbi:MAG: D-alanine--D-alanine ligase [Planctomycetes bacterium]|nr:D-alanine--D-alanine ligase [Planctomycetota bacterium]